MKTDNPIAVALMLTAVSLMVVLTAGAGSGLAQEARYCSWVSGPACPELPDDPFPWESGCTNQSGWPAGQCLEGGFICESLLFPCGWKVDWTGRVTTEECDDVNTCSSPLLSVRPR